MVLSIPQRFDPGLAEALQDPFFAGCLDSPAATDPANFDKLLKVVQQFAVTPLSGFKVSALALGKSGRCFIGANMEFSGVPLSASLHAEQSAVLNAWMHGETAIESLIISELPCGHCRQFLQELSNAGSLMIQVKGTRYVLPELLPQPFTSMSSGGQTLLDGSTRPLTNARPVTDDTAQRAINAARRSYAPYSQSPEGFVIETINGHNFAGRSAESIAFNPTVAAATTALNQLNLSAHRKEAITACTHARLPTAMTHSYAFSVALMRGICKVPVQSVLMETEV